MTENLHIEPALQDADPKDPAIQMLHQKALDFMMAEGKWIDEVVRSTYPRWVIFLAELSRIPMFRFIQGILAKRSGLEVKRHQSLDLLKKGGFKPGSYRITSIRVEIRKKGVTIAEKTFNLSIVVPAEHRNAFSKLIF